MLKKKVEKDNSSVEKICISPAIFQHNMSSTEDNFASHFFAEITIDVALKLSNSNNTVGSCETHKWA